MSDPIRYTGKFNSGQFDKQILGSPHWEHPDGEWVKWEDYACLKAEFERLRKAAVTGGYNLSEYIRMANSETLEFDNGDIFAEMTLPERIKYIVESHARLKAEVERLRASSFVTAVPVEEYEKLKAEVERLQKENINLRKYGDDMYRLVLEDSTGMWTFTKFQKWKSLK